MADSYTKSTKNSQTDQKVIGLTHAMDTKVTNSY